jgi:YHS domain-containing protein
VVLDRLAALGNQAGAGPLQPIGPVTARGRVVDPVCRMVVDAATAPGHDAYLGQTYYFCSTADARAFADNRARYAARYQTIAFGVPKTYALSLSGGAHLRAGQTAALVLAVRSGNNKGAAANGTLETKFQTVHEKLMHLIVVSSDLSYFSHEHPKLGADGRFRLRRTFPGAGQYWLFADFTPQDGMNQLLRVGVKVSGAAAP